MILFDPAPKVKTISSIMSASGGGKWIGCMILVNGVGGLTV